MPNVLTEGLTEQQLALRPFCKTCNWRRGGVDSWDGVKCKCGKTAPTFKKLFAMLDESEEKVDRLDPDDPDEENAATYHATRAEWLRAFLNAAFD